MDQETQSGVKPHTMYVILSWWEGDGEERREGVYREDLLTFLFSYGRGEVKDNESQKVSLSLFFPL